MATPYWASAVSNPRFFHDAEGRLRHHVNASSRLVCAVLGHVYAPMLVARETHGEAAVAGRTIDDIFDEVRICGTCGDRRG